MPAPDLVLALDVGTQSVRALVFDRAGRLQARDQQPLAPPFVSPQPGWAEQDPEVWWQAAARACAAVAEAVGPARLAALALTTQRGTVVCAEEDGTPRRPALVWPDQRLCDSPPPLGPLWGTAFRLAGAHDLVQRLQRQAEVNWLAQHDPSWPGTPRVALLSGWLTQRLVGEWVDSAGGQVGYLPFDYRRQAWCRPRAWQWRALAVRPAQLPRLVAPGQPLGALADRAAADLGLPARLPVIAAAADKACEVLGAGVAGPGAVHLSFGTAAAVNTVQPRYVEVQRLLPAYPAAVPGHWCTEVHVERGFWLVSWFREQFGQPEVARAAALGVPPETLFEGLLAATPPGAMGLVALPHWSPGLRDPGPEAKGALLGFGDVHGRAHLYRALLEGLVMQLRAGRERIERATGQRCGRLVVSGGGSRSDGALQIAADVFGLPAERPQLADASALGAAMIAATALGWHADVPAAARAMAAPVDRFEPRRDALRLYDALYAEVFQPLAKASRPINRRIRAITGYPA